jgi:hypothetical protein
MSGTYWSVEQCRWVDADAGADLYWSVQRCRWEPVGGPADALATPWSMFQAAQPEAEVPQQREPAPAPQPVDA